MSANKSRAWIGVAIFFIVVSIVLAVALIVIGLEWHNLKQDKNNEQTQSGALNQSENGYMEKADPSPFDELTVEEYKQVFDFILAQKELSLVSAADASTNSNYVYLIDTVLPDKKDILAHIDEGGEMPVRSARVIGIMGAKSPPVIEEYIVSPIPNPSQYRLYINPIQPNPIPFSARPDFGSIPELKAQEKAMSEITEVLYPVLAESYGYWYHNCTGTGRCLYSMTAARNLGPNSDRYIILYFFRTKIDGYYLYPIDLSIMIRSDLSDTERYYADYIYYKDQVFRSAEDLLRKYKAGSIQKEKFPVPKDGPVYGSPARKRVGEKWKKPPVQTLPEGNRFKVKGQHVEYLDWSFNFRLRTTTGLHLLDVRHGNERIAYEIGMADIAVYYGGKAPYGVIINYLDAGWVIGSLFFEMIRGVDCPSNAQYFDNTFFSPAEATTVTYKNVLCIFELDTGLPLRRHFSADLYGEDHSDYHYFFSVPDTVLVVRTIATVWNYDYIFDYLFHQNGVIEIKVASTGYVQAQPAGPGTEKYGFNINNEYKVMAPLHHHMFNFKVDLDIGGTKNRFATWDIKVENQTHPYVPNTRLYRKYFTQDLRRTEKDALIKYNFDEPKYYVVYNENNLNSAGNKRGYRVFSNQFAKLMLPEGWQIENAVSWARHQVAVTKHKDNEDTTATPYNQIEANYPIRKFERFYEDNENIVDEDLVVWACVGLHHIPVVEDVAVTTTAGKQLGVVLMPMNFFDEDPSMMTQDGVLRRPEDKK